MKPPNWQIKLILLVGILAVSTVAIFTRLAFNAANQHDVGLSLVLASSRVTLAALMLLPKWHKVYSEQTNTKALRYAVLAGIFLALHFASWSTSLAYTSIAPATTLVTTTSIWVILFSWIWLKECPTLFTAIGAVVAVLGGALVGIGDIGASNGGSSPILGNFLALVGAWTNSLYYLFGREAQRQGISISFYAVIVYITAALILVPTPFAFGATYIGYPQEVYIYMLLIALVPQLVGHTSLNWAMRWVSPTLVTLTILFVPVIASLLGYIIFGEMPKTLIIIGGVVIFSGMVIAANGSK